VEQSVITYGRYLPLKSAVIFGGVKINPQIDKLRRGVDILVATPGRLLDHARQKTVDLSKVEVLILDEADRMLDMGFIHDIRKILALLPNKAQRQNLLFSATFSNEIKQLSNQLLNQPELVEVARRNAPIELIAQLAHPVDQSRKREILSHMIGAGNWRQVLVFTRTKHGANRLAKQLVMDGLSATAIHGNKSQGARTRALADFKQGSVRILVATDIAARGLDIDQLPHVVNYELPNVPEDYVHRIGRTGRAGNEGTAISLVSAEENRLLRDIERLINREIPKQVLPGYEPTGRVQARSDDRADSGRQGQRRSNHAPNAGTNGRSNGRSASQNNVRSNGQSNSRSNGQGNSRSNGQGNSRSNGQGNSRSNVQAIDSNHLRSEATRSANGERAARKGASERSPAGARPVKPGYSSLAGRMFSETDSN
jgi:ATP-dependent RNA helicase RhlE